MTGLGIIVGTTLLFLGTSLLNVTPAHAESMPSAYSTQTLKKNGFTKRIIPKQYRGTWYDKDESRTIEKLKITKTKLFGFKVMVANKLVKIKGQYRLGVYSDGHLTYLSVSSKPKMLRWSLVTPAMKGKKVNKHQISRNIIADYLSFTNKKQAKASNSPHIY